MGFILAKLIALLIFEPKDVFSIIKKSSKPIKISDTTYLGETIRTLVEQFFERTRQNFEHFHLKY